jgi:tRNA dimethylallyltransferase
VARNGIGRHALAITGPTACGKTGFALALAREFPVEIISMDSAMVYRGMDIGTAKPEPAERKAVVHHLIDILDPEETYSAGRFAADCAGLIAAINARGRVALVVGGTMLYLRALREGIAALPERDPGIRQALDARAEAIGWPALHAELGAVDPEAARRIEPTDRQRIQRALEVHAITGRRLSELQREPGETGVDLPVLAMIPADRQALGDAIARRFQVMLEAGLVDEVKRLRQRPRLGADSASMRSVGYRQLWAWLEGHCTLAEAETKAIVATRQLAKRQLTWLRRDSLSEKFESGAAALTESARRCLQIAVQSLNIV